MPWHLLFESFNPAAVSGLCHAMGSVGVLFCQSSELKLFNRHFGLKWSWWIAWLIRCHRPLISPQNRSCLAQKLGPLAWRYDTMGGGGTGVLGDEYLYSYLLATSLKILKSCCSETLSPLEAPNLWRLWLIASYLEMWFPNQICSDSTLLWGLGVGWIALCSSLAGYGGPKGQRPTSDWWSRHNTGGKDCNSFPWDDYWFLCLFAVCPVGAMMTPRVPLVIFSPPLHSYPFLYSWDPSLGKHRWNQCCISILVALFIHQNSFLSYPCATAIHRFIPSASGWGWSWQCAASPIAASDICRCPFSHLERLATASKSVQCSNTLNRPVDRHVIVKL